MVYPSSSQLLTLTTSKVGVRYKTSIAGNRQNVLNMAVIGPRQGFGSCLSGCLIFKRDTVCSRTGFIAVEAPRGGILLRCKSAEKGRWSWEDTNRSPGELEAGREGM
jgi:hypothetical protein